MLPREIQAEHWPDRTTYDLPMRPIGALRFLGLLPMAFSVAFVWMPGHFLLGLFHQLGRDKAGFFLWIPIAFLCAFVIAGLVPFTIGLFMLIGRTRLVVTRERIIATEIAGPVRRSRKIKVADIERLEYGGARTEGQTANATPAWLKQIGGLTAILRNGKKSLLLIGYPRDWVEAMAEELSGSMQQVGTKVEINEVEPLTRNAETPTEELVSKPASSLVQLETRVNGLVLEIPPAGLRKGGKGLFSFAIIWCLFMTVFTCAMCFGKDHNGQRPPWGAWLFIAGFWGIGLTMLASAINMGRRRAVLTVESGGLRVDQHGLFGANSREWQRGQISAVRVDRSGMEVNHVPLMQLQIHPVGGKKFGLLTGRPEDELRWIASELRRALSVPASKTPVLVSPVTDIARR
jgi:hypothetical protein